MPGAVPEKWDVVALNTVDSTNAEALRRARQGHLGPLWIRANAQSAGRGRQGKAWSSGQGNLYCTVLLAGERDPQLWTQLSFVAGLAVYDAAACNLAAAGEHHLAVKWPNDLLLNGQKASGILIESTTVAQLDTALAIGIGVNVSHSPPGDGLAYGATHLSSVNDAADVSAVFNALRESFANWHTAWDHGKGFESIRETWMQRAHGLGEQVNVNRPDGKISGRFLSLDDDGAMVLQMDDGTTQRVLVGDLFLAAETAAHSSMVRG